MNYDACIKKSIEYIENNLNKKIQLKELADKAFLSKYHFHRVFHSVVGEPVAEYIRKKRLEEASNELLTTENKIIDIALKYQFSNQESFTRAFKKLYGIPPKEFRKNKINLTTIHSRKNSTTYLSMVA
ncbi:helix-turn-helix transcriptional regulator [Clostridium beijerinckii]|uniref:helix-turn-helix transcriptional regulator n=1 Tax=Clostridium beijerinckii TaxID=1520 RepID=UPI0014945C3A|nr:AraC family transcriptional regulator [Clostridium beijerinckii]NOW05703.1 AraC family transcriptional regulator [Clostridium beijerinckii]NYC01153.1 AraC family transcriptional regulator [Clostridium beijerinckii]